MNESDAKILCEVNAGTPMRIGADESNGDFLARMRHEIEALRGG